MATAQSILSAGSAAMETLQSILSAGFSFFEAIQLSNDLSRLRSSLPKAHIVINRAEWGRFKDNNLALLLSQLKDTTCDAEDLLREFDDQELRQKMEDTDRNIAGQLVSSSLNLAKSFFIGSKTRLKEAQSKLDMVVAETEAALNLMGLNVKPMQLGKPLMPETSSVIGVPIVYGREEERDLVIVRLGVMIGRDNERDHAIKLLGVPLTRSAKKVAALGMGAVASTPRAAKRLKGESSKVVSTNTNCCTGHVLVLPIVGIGGVGKTTLAQYIYSDKRVKTHFDVRLWVCVSDIFDKKRITKDIIESITGEEFKRSSSLDALHIELKKLLMNNKFLLVLDDVWLTDENEWDAFFAPFLSGIDGSMILLTTRSPKVAKLVSRVNPIELEGLPTDIFWEFFKKCAFSGQNPELYPQLQDIGRSIAGRLKGSPLAAKTLGRLLSMELTEQNWRDIHSSELWQLPQEDNEILPALQLSYLYLPWELKRCFAVCSMFPKDYSFKQDEIVAFWVAQCYVESDGSIRLEDMGRRYLDDLRSRFLFQTDPKYPKQSRYVMHDLIHDMAQSVSVGECFLISKRPPLNKADLSYKNLQRPPHTVRHISIEVGNEALRRMGGIKHLNKLHSLRLAAIFEVEVSCFKHLSNILFLSLKGCKLVKLPESICELKSLRCLDISESSIQELPEKFWSLYSLQYFYANRLKAIHQNVTKLVNLRHLDMHPEATLKLSKISGLGNMSCLQNLKKFTLAKENGRRIGELKGMDQLSGKLCIDRLYHVHNMEEASEVRLVDKQDLKELHLRWGNNGFSRRSEQAKVLEGLHPPSSIESLRIDEYFGDRFPPSWFKHKNLPVLRTLHMSGNSEVERFDLQRTLDSEAPRTSAGGALGGSVGGDSANQASINGIDYNACLPFISLTTLRIYRYEGLANLEQCLSPEYLPSIQSIQLEGCTYLESLPVHKFGGFLCLQDLKIVACWRLVCQTEMILPQSLRRLFIKYSGELDKSMKPGCLENLASLTLLHLESCDNVESIQLNSINRNNLKGLVLKDCPKLSSIGGSHSLSSIQHVDISYCPKLAEVEQPLLKKGLRQSELSKLQSFYINCKTSIQLSLHFLFSLIFLANAMVFPFCGFSFH